MTLSRHLGSTASTTARKRLGDRVDLGSFRLTTELESFVIVAGPWRRDAAAAWPA
jgi:hypothetical protein